MAVQCAPEAEQEIDANQTHGYLLGDFLSTVKRILFME